MKEDRGFKPSLGYIVEAFREKGGKRHIDKARETERKTDKNMLVCIGLHY